MRSDGSLTANSIAIASALSRRAMKPRMLADSRSSHCASSTTHSSGRFVEASASMVSAARARRKRSGESVRRRPSAPARASRCGAGRVLSLAETAVQADAARRSLARSLIRSPASGRFRSPGLTRRHSQGARSCLCQGLLEVPRRRCGPAAPAQGRGRSAPAPAHGLSAQPGPAVRRRAVRPPSARLARSWPGRSALR